MPADELTAEALLNLHRQHSDAAYHATVFFAELILKALEKHGDKPESTV